VVLNVAIAGIVADDVAVVLSVIDDAFVVGLDVFIFTVNIDVYTVVAFIDEIGFLVLL